MGTVVELATWQRRRASRGTPGADAGWGRRAALDRLEAAVGRLDDLVHSGTASIAGLEAEVRTEVLAILGAIAVDMIEDAATRAEDLLDRVGAGDGR